MSSFNFQVNISVAACIVGHFQSVLVPAELQYGQILDLGSWVFSLIILWYDFDETKTTLLGV